MMKKTISIILLGCGAYFVVDAGRYSLRGSAMDWSEITLGIVLMGLGLIGLLRSGQST